MINRLTPPGPWIGGKGRIVDVIWSRLGNPYNYIVPFCGMMPDILARPHTPNVETVNDVNPYVANSFRALRDDPNEVAFWADRPINEADLHAIHRWLVGIADVEPLIPDKYKDNELAREAYLAGYARQDGSYVKAFRRRMVEDPDYYDARIAGLWLYGLSCWIGPDFCPIYDEDKEREPSAKRPNIGNVSTGRGLMAITQKRPSLSRKGAGVHANKLHQSKPYLSKGQQGIHSDKLHQKKPQLQRSPGTGIHRASLDLLAYFEQISERLRRVRVLCGDWKRAVTPAVLMTEQKDRVIEAAVLLDPPYSAESGRDPNLYACDSLTVAHDVREWAIANGNRKNLRLALCGLEGEHIMPADWECVAWQGSGYGNQSDGQGRINSARERIWFSPSCIRQETLFDHI